MNGIQAFVVTYNRPDLLYRQLSSIAAQTVMPCSVVVLDDGPNSETKRVVQKFASSGIKYERTERPGLWGNIYEAQQRAAYPYTVVLHDDDCLHSRYFELIGKVLTAHPGLTLASCNAFNLPPESEIPFSKDVDTLGNLMDAREFTSFFFNDNGGNFPFFVYKTENFRKMDIYKYLDYNGPYGKHGDSAFVPLAAGEGKVAMLSCELANYGIHAGQAVSDSKSLPDARCWARVEAVFHKLLGDDLRTFAGFSYAFRNYHRLRSGYRRRGTHDYPFREYLRYCAEFGAVSPYMNRFRWCCNHYTEKALLNYGKKMFRSRRVVL